MSNKAALAEPREQPWGLTTAADWMELPLVLGGLLLPYSTAGSKPEVWRAWATAVLCMGQYDEPPGDHNGLPEKSAAMRQIRALVEPLTPSERADLERLAENGPEPQIVGRVLGALRDRITSVDREDAERQRAKEIALVGYGRRGADERRKVLHEQVVAEVERQRQRSPMDSHNKHCKNAAQALGVSPSRVRHIVPAGQGRG